jgi:hypothetical protein
MPIVHPTAPVGGFDVVRSHLRSILGRPSLDAARTLASVAPNQLSVSDPHRCYTVSLDDLAQGRLLSTARPGSWRYLVFASGHATADAEVLDNGIQGLEFASVGHGTMAASAVEAFHMAEALPEVQADDYEVRCLKIPALYLVALWFHGPAGDIIVPTDPTPPALAAHQPYSEVQLLALLTGPAVAKKQAYDADATGQLGG